MNFFFYFIIIIEFRIENRDEGGDALIWFLFESMLCKILFIYVRKPLSMQNTYHLITNLIVIHISYRKSEKQVNSIDCILSIHL